MKKSFTSTGHSVFRDIYNQPYYSPHYFSNSIIKSTKDSKDYVKRLGLQCRLQVHAGCVNSVCWNSTGEYILSGSDDQNIAITNPYNQKTLVKYKTAHRANIFSAKFLPQTNDHGIVSCSGDGVVLYTELTQAGDLADGGTDLSNPANVNLNYFNCHNNGTSYEVLTMPSEPNSFLSCGEDGTVRIYDLRLNSRCHKTCCKDNILIFSQSAITAMALAPTSTNHIAVGSSDGLIRIYDRRFLSIIDFENQVTKKYTTPYKAFSIPSDAKRPYRVTSVKYSEDESEILVSYSSDFLYMFDLTNNGIDLNSSMFKKFDKNSPESGCSSSPPVRKLRLRGDWSDTGPDARPEGNSNGRVEIGQVRPQLHGSLMHRMTEVLSRMLSDPRTRIGLTGQSNEISPDNHSLFVTAAREFEDYAGRGASGSVERSRSRPDIATDGNNTENDEPQPGTSSSVRLESTQRFEGDSEMTLERRPSSMDVDEETRSINDELSKIDMDTKDYIYDYVKHKYTGHRNARTMIKEAAFWGDDYVMSGSDCGHVFIWNRRTAELEMLLQADSHVVNCLQPHPYLPFLATSGIDYDVKLWAPILQETTYNERNAKSLMERNAIMLEETKDTITVPAAFMIRMLACIHSLRNRNRPDFLNGNAVSNSNARSNSDPSSQSSS